MKNLTTFLDYENNYSSKFNKATMFKFLVPFGILCSLAVGGIYISSFVNSKPLEQNYKQLNINLSNTESFSSTPVVATNTEIEQSPIELKLSTNLEDSISFASGAIRLGPLGREKAYSVWSKVNPDTQQLYLYGYTGNMKNKQKMTDLARHRAISTKIYMVNEFNANPKDITVVDPKYYLHKEPLPENSKQVKTVIRNKE